MKTPLPDHKPQFRGWPRRSFWPDWIRTPLPDDWRLIPGYDGRYEISTSGVIRPVKRPNHRRVVLRDKKGYDWVRLWAGDCVRCAPVHTLLWEAFWGPVPPLTRILHVDGYPWHNQLSNLALRMPGARRGPNISQHTIDFLRALIAMGKSYADAARVVQVTGPTVKKYAPKSLYGPKQ